VFRFARRLRASSIAALIFSAVLISVGPALAQDDVDDLMGGFDDDFDVSEIEGGGDEIHPWLAALPQGEWIAENVDLSGSLETGAVYNYLDHDVEHGDQPGRRTQYGNLSRLDLDGFLQLDVQLPHDWLLRGEALGWYDFVYRAKGRGQYGGAVLDVYEWQVDSGEVYASGPLTEKVDLTLGRKVVNWGRSDTFRIVDVVNPLDNKEPGLVDIEDLRRPRTMVKLDATSGPWSGTLLVIPEHRYDRQPPLGSEFFFDLAKAPFLRSRTIESDDDFQGTPGFAAKFGGSFSGWDFTLYGAYVEETSRVLDSTGSFFGTLFQLESNRFGLAGVAGNYTVDAWLFKIESAYLHDVHILRASANPPFLESDGVDRFDTMVGVEYFGPDSLVIALEIVNRHYVEKISQVVAANAASERSRFETALRISRPFFRERLDVTLLGLAIGERFQGGGLVRLSADFELTDSWSMDGGILIFIGGPDDGLGAFDSNDRLFASLKYSF
jgi:hypothetical protein